MVIILILGGVWWWQQKPDGQMHLVFCDVGQGDAAIVSKGNVQVLMDTGPDIKKLTACLGEHIPFWDHEIEVVIISHPQRDHNGALAELKKIYKVDRVIDKPRTGDVLRVGSLSFDILSAADPEAKVLGETSSAENEDSVVTELKYGQFTALFTGDIGVSTELALESSPLLTKIDVLKVAHHGSKYSSAESFLKFIEPKEAVISVGAKNTYGHPASDTLIHLDAVGAKIWRTDKQGSVEYVSNGKTWAKK